MGKKTAITICVLLLVYFIFTSGLVFEIRGNNNLSITDIPYSIALSGKETGLLGVFTEDDIVCAKWLGKTKDTMILADYNGINLVSDYVLGYKRIGTYNTYDKLVKNPFYNKKPVYLFLTCWNVENNKMVVGISPALRDYEPIPSYPNMIEVFRSGGAVVYYSDKG